MSDQDQVPMFDSLPVYQEDLDRVKKPKKDFQNYLYATLNRLMSHFKTEAGVIHRATGIPYPTLSDWINANVEVQKLDENIKKLARHFGVSVDFLVYGTPMTDFDYELDDLMEEFTDIKTA